MSCFREPNTWARASYFVKIDKMVGECGWLFASSGIRLALALFLFLMRLLSRSFAPRPPLAYLAALSSSKLVWVGFVQARRFGTEMRPILQMRVCFLAWGVFQRPAVTRALLLVVLSLISHGHPGNDRSRLCGHTRGSRAIFLHASRIFLNTLWLGPWFVEKFAFTTLSS